MSTEKRTLSKAQRHKIYSQLLEKSSKPGFNRKHFEPLDSDGPTEDDAVPGLCWALSHMGHYVYEPEIMERKFPELHAQKPLVSSCRLWWWPMGDWKVRNKVLQKAIEQTTPNTK